MRSTQVNHERLSETLNDIIKEIHEDADPIELDEYRRVFKKNVSIFKRAYVAAYMLKHYSKGSDYNRGSNRGSDRRPDRGLARRSVHKRVQNVSDMESLFMSIGRTRRVFPRDVIGMILDKTDLDRADIGNIKVLDNYSFIDIAPPKASRVIQALNGLEYRGRTLNVSYAKKKNPA